MSDPAFTRGPLEVAGNFVRTARRPEDMSGRIVAEFPLTNPNRYADAQLFVAAGDLYNVAVAIHKEIHDLASLSSISSSLATKLFLAIKKAEETTK